MPAALHPARVQLLRPARYPTIKTQKRGIIMNTAITAILGSGLAALTIGLATPAAAAPSGPTTDSGPGTTQQANPARAFGWLDGMGMTAYGTYQNHSPRQSGPRQ